MRLALIGDIHYYRLAVAPWQLFGKRLLGQANLWLNRRHRFNRSLLKPVLERAQSIQPDMVLMSGDLTTTALPGEFADVAAQLTPLINQVPTVVVPGNHDRYTFSAARHRVMEKSLPTAVPQQFPKLQKLTPHWYLLALDVSVPRLLTARGRAGRAQLRKVRHLTMGLSADDGLVVLCHYPLNSPPRALPITWDHKLADSRRLRRILSRCKARVLYMHGHIHRPWCWQPKRSDQAHFTYLNAGSPCMTTGRYPYGQGFWQIDLPQDPTAHIDITHHIPQSASGLSGNGVPDSNGASVITHPDKPIVTKLTWTQNKVL